MSVRKTVAVNQPDSSPNKTTKTPFDLFGRPLSAKPDSVADPHAAPRNDARCALFARSAARAPMTSGTVRAAAAAAVPR